MKPMTTEWVAKVEGDYFTVERECRARKRQNYDAVCFHAQQCAEKYLKALMCEEGITAPWVHSLVALLELLLPLRFEWEVFREDLAFLSSFAVAFRYPGESACKESAIDARRRCRRFREAARAALLLEEN